MHKHNLQQALIHTDPWASLRAFTAARIALGRTGTAIPLQEVLSFRMAHAHARDAVYSLLQVEPLTQQLTVLGLPVNQLHSQAADRHEYLQRPDKGRRLNEGSVAQLMGNNSPYTSDAAIAIILADGLSATAVNHHAVPLLSQLIPLLQNINLRLLPVSLVQQGRVAIGDEIAMLQQATLVVVLIGERPGLSSPDSLGIYITYQPRVGLTDEARNCISNVRPEGLSYQAAADKLYWLIRESLRLRVSGVELKDQEGLLNG
ncbi:ethanolamine ammonia-lyase subunit EutC [Paraflavitalea sp. CAU 1676]|uniref:ethanolamine ammonia-lyase subunit EutC n=1 Tax=Paraflavitalea sp. CAU 1676 TaxID=3032598 RepID=UPI0023D9E15E|nr:ethanolamine ammonia-lyase subunit EutC [Paraflavitalea sp. CAU 1676]MDF2192837.1 ethanolamine ammonia-lyase subunit EutC [Paraflavitalea sp. CAU 1676]